MICEHIVEFVDGELEPHLANEFRSHLPTCKDCNREVLKHVQMTAQISSLKSLEPTLEDLVLVYLRELDHFRNQDTTGEELTKAEIALRQFVWKPDGPATRAAERERRIGSAIGRTGLEYCPPAGWQQRVLNRIEREQRWYRRAWRWLWGA